MGKIIQNNISKLLLFNLIYAAPLLEAMAPLRNASRKNLLKSSTAFSLPTCKPTFQQLPISTPQQPKFSSFSGGNQNRYQKYQQKAEQFAKKYPNKITFAKGFLGAAIGTTVLTSIIDEAKAIAETARKKFDMNMFTEMTGTARKRFNLYMFNENLISDEFSRAIVPLYSDYNRASAFIVKSEHNPNLYFVLTAAHCVPIFGNGKQHIQLQNSGECLSISVEPLIVNRDEDIAVLFIPSAEIKKFKIKTGRSLPSIPAKQLSSFKPSKYEAFGLQGYPNFKESSSGTFKDFYREKLVYEEMKEATIPGTKYRGAWLARSDKDKPKKLGGASGSPVFVIRDKQPHVLGVHSGGFYARSPECKSYAVAAGLEELPNYLQKAEKKVNEVKS